MYYFNQSQFFDELINPGEKSKDGVKKKASELNRARDGENRDFSPSRVLMMIINSSGTAGPIS